jgi:hypothetical protein
MRCSQKKTQQIRRKTRIQQANDFGYMLATHSKAPEGLYNLPALCNGVPDGHQCPAFRYAGDSAADLDGLSDCA